MQAITVKYLSPTNTKGARLKADCKGGSVTIGYPYHLLDGIDSRLLPHFFGRTEGEKAARIACDALCEKLGWDSSRRVGGQLKNQDYVFVAN